MSGKRDERVFLVRMWRDGDGPEVPDWRGSIYDVETGRRFYLGAPAEVAEFVANALREGRRS